MNLIREDVLGFLLHLPPPLSSCPSLSAKALRIAWRSGTVLCGRPGFHPSSMRIPSTRVLAQSRASTSPSSARYFVSSDFERLPLGRGTLEHAALNAPTAWSDER